MSMQRSMQIKLFGILWLTGMAGVVSLLGINLPIPEEIKLQFPVWAIKLLILIQPTLLLTISVSIGVFLASKVRLSAPLAEAISSGNALDRAIKPQLVPGIIGGLVGGILLVAIQLSAQLFLPSDFTVKAAEMSRNTSFLTRILYGGITEELLLRWGMMTLFVWIGWRIFGKGQGKPPAFCFVGAIVLSAVLFGLGHLPLAFALGTPVNNLTIAYIIVANSVFGLIAGYLYWQKGLEAAMISHVLVHLVMVTAIR